jgi:hypothetical protein
MARPAIGLPCGAFSALLSVDPSLPDNFTFGVHRIVCRLLPPIVLVLIISVSVRAQPGDVAFTDQNSVPWRSPMDGFAPPATAVSGPKYVPPIQDHADPIGEPPWCTSPYRSSAWRFGIDLIPTVSHVSENGFGKWSGNGSLALRLSLGYEGGDGFGTRVQLWGFDDRQNTLVGDVELAAATFYWDFYKRFYIENAELVLGGGLAGAGLEYDVKSLDQRAELSSGGLSIFGEGFYPFLRFAKMDVGSIGRARFALLSGEWDDHGTPFMRDTDHDVTTIIELAWGLEFRRRFGRLQDKYWYIDIVPEFQRWESASLSGVFDPAFQGTAINFGLAW